MTVVDEILIPAGLNSAAATAALRGREPALTLVDRRLADLRGGHGNVLLVEGEPGMGKTRLLGELRRRAGQARLPVLRAEAVDGQQDVRFGPLLAAMLSAQPPIAEVRHLRDLSRRGDTDYWIVHELRDGLRRMSARAPVVMILDSLQWADPATISAVRSLSVELRESAVLWVLAARRDQAGDGLRDLFTQLADSGADTMSLRGLPDAVVPAMIEEVVGAAATPRLLGLAAMANGHPFWLTQLLRGLQEEDRPHAARAPATLPRRITRLMRERLEALTPMASRMVRMAAVLPSRFSADQLASLLGGHAADLIEPLDEAIRAGVLAVDGARMCFRPELLRNATRETMPFSLRQALEREAADVLLRAGVNPVEVAATVADTAERGDRSAAFVLRAAARTLAVSDVDAAAGLYLRVFGLLGPGDGERGPVAAEAADLLHRAHRVDEAVVLADRAIAERLPSESEAELRLALSSMTARPLTDRLRENHLALSLSGIAERTRTRHHIRLAHNLLLAGDHESASRLAHRTVTGRREDVDLETETAARLVLAVTYLAEGDGGAASAELTSMRRTGTSYSCGADDVLTAALWYCLGRDEEGDTVLNDCLSQARRERNGPLLGLTTHLRAQYELLAGRLPEARATLDSAGPERHEQGWARVLRMVTVAGLAVHQGDQQLGRAATAAAKDLRSTGGPVERCWAERILAVAAAQRDDAAYACRLLAQDSLMPGTPPVPYDVSFLIVAARAAVTAGDRGLVERVTAAAAALAVDAAAAPALAAAADHVARLVADDAPGLLAVADRHAASRPLLAAAAAEDAARVLLTEGTGTAAVDQLDRAFDIYTAAGAVADVQRLRRALRRHGKIRRALTRRPSSGWESLTEAELKVVHIVAAGVTNRDAAERLRLSPHTVNAHLRNAFTKLGITSRVHLANIVRDNVG